MDESTIIVKPEYCRTLSMEKGVALVVVSRDEAIVGSLLTEHLAIAAGVPAETCVIDSVARQSPRVTVHGAVDASCRVSLSRRGGWIAGAAIRGLRIGIDLERPEPDFGWEAVAEDYFPAEIFRELRALPEAEARLSFVRRWARLEAGLKALGTGFGGDPTRSSWHRIQGLPCEDLELVPGFALSVAFAPFA